MNHFIGFNCWSHSVTMVESVRASDLQDRAILQTAGCEKTAQAVARVCVVCPGGITVERQATGEGSSSTAFGAITRAHKTAVTNALHTALSSLAIVRWPSGKAVVRLLPGTEPD
jgi:hypothetical protein